MSSPLSHLDPKDVPGGDPHATAREMRTALYRIGSDDPESGHGDADTLMRAALIAIRDGHPDPVWLAYDVLHIEDADFPRWYA